MILDLVVIRVLKKHITDTKCKNQAGLGPKKTEDILKSMVVQCGVYATPMAFFKKQEWVDMTKMIYRAVKVLFS